MSIEETIVTVTFGDPGEVTVDVASPLDTFTEEQFAQWLLELLENSSNELANIACEQQSTDDNTPVISVEQYHDVYAELSLYIPPGNGVISNVVFGGLADPNTPHYESTTELSQRLLTLVSTLGQVNDA